MSLATRVIRTSIIRTPKILLFILYSCLTRTFCNTISMYFTYPKFSLIRSFHLSQQTFFFLAQRDSEKWGCTVVVNIYIGCFDFWRFEGLKFGGLSGTKVTTI